MTGKDLDRATLERKFAEIKEAVVRLEDVARDMLFLAEGLHEDDSWYGHRRKACKRIAKARKELKLPPSDDVDPNCAECG